MFIELLLQMKVLARNDALVGQEAQNAQHDLQTYMLAVIILIGSGLLHWMQ